MGEGQSRSISERLAELRGFAFDLDGTIWEGPRLMPGAVSLVEDLRASGIGVVFASNSSRHASGVLRAHLTELGIASAPNEMLAALDLAGEVIRRRMGSVRVLPLGTDELSEILISSGHELVPEAEWKAARAVVVGIDPHFSYDRLRAAARAVRRGCGVLHRQPGSTLPGRARRVRPGLRCARAGHRRGWGIPPECIGKPEPPLFREAIDRLGCARTRPPWSATARPPTSKAAAPPGCSRSG